MTEKRRNLWLLLGAASELAPRHRGIPKVPRIPVELVEAVWEVESICCAIDSPLQPLLATREILNRAQSKHSALHDFFYGAHGRLIQQRHIVLAHQLRYQVHEILGLPVW